MRIKAESLEAQQAKVDATKAELAREYDQLDEERTAIKAREVRLQDLQNETELQSQEATIREADLDARKAALEVRANILADQEARLADDLQIYKEDQRQLDQVREELTKLESELTDRQTTLDDRHKEFDEENDALQSLKDELQGRKEEFDTSIGELQVERQEVETQKTELNAVRAELNDQFTRVAAWKESMESLLSRLPNVDSNQADSNDDVLVDGESLRSTDEWQVNTNQIESENDHEAPADDPTDEHVEDDVTSVDEVAELEDLQSTISDILDLTQTSTVDDGNDGEAVNDGHVIEESDQQLETPDEVKAPADTQITSADVTQNVPQTAASQPQVREAEDRMRRHFRSKRASNIASAVFSAVLVYIFTGTKLIENSSSLWVAAVAASVSLFSVMEAVKVNSRLHTLEKQIRERKNSPAAMVRQPVVRQEQPSTEIKETGKEAISSS